MYETDRCGKVRHVGNSMVGVFGILPFRCLELGTLRIWRYLVL